LVLGSSAFAAKKTDKEFKAKFFGEGGQTYPNTPDQSDYQTAEPEYQKPPAQKPSTLPAAQAPVPVMTQPVAVPAHSADVVVARPEAESAAAPAYRPVWPGATRPGHAASAHGQPSSQAAGAEPLKDAPAPARYSLWSGLNAPMMLPASKVGQVTADQAKSIGRLDYESHILGAKSEAGMPMEKGPGGPALADAVPESGEGLFVTLDVDVTATPGEYRDAVAEISQRSGLRIDERFPPAFDDAAKTRVSLRGWVAPSQLGEVFGPNVQRLRVERSPARSVPDLPVTELLVGIRIPQGASPSATLATALERLSQGPGFKLKRVIGYQPIPGTSQMVLVVAGKVPVQRIAQVLGDPLVVKVVPSPEPVVSAPNRPQALWGRLSKRFFSYAASKEPRLLAGTVLLTLLLAGTLFLRARKR